MASVCASPITAIPNQDLEEMKRLLWGTDIKYEVFRRWTQGIIFSEDETTALIQLEGGPCAIIAPLQAYLLKHAMFNQNLGNNWREINEEQREQLLCHTLAEMLSLVSSSDTTYLVHYLPQGGSTEPSLNGPVHSNTASTDAELPNSNNEGGRSSSDGAYDGACDGSSGADNADNSTTTEDNGSSPKKRCLSHEEFHLSLRCRKCHSKEETLNQLKTYISELHKKYGVLLILYSFVLTKGIEQLKNEVEDSTEPLIDGTYGHGSQSLINLLISGRAVNNVWDNDKDLSGLTLHGITARATIGFLTLLEHLRYCEVGWYLKNPQVPIWILGSETHLTVLFSEERNLVSLESPEAEARRIFCNFDPEGRGFIPCDNLQNLMSSLNLVSETEYVKIMMDKLDPEQLGIITMNSFLEEFFPHETGPEEGMTFTLMHCNGLARSGPNKKVQYVRGKARISNDMPDVQIITDMSVIKTCLTTKWPTIELTWEGDHIPSLN